MRDLNKALIMGRLGADPIQRFTKSGMSVVHFSVATSRKIKSDALGLEDREETEWHKIVVWGKQGEVCAQYLKKGSPVLIEGMIRSHSYDSKDGTKKTAFEIHADQVSFLNGSHKDPVVQAEHAEIQ
ncbi:MAG: single-stranded DNA-binding protein [Bdellovibrio sp.]|nr:single-stranded DNA-binding protein [Bdellovibrio sp.]